MDGHIAQHVAVLDEARAFILIDSARDAADILLARDAGISDGDIPNRAVLYKAEQPLEGIRPYIAAVLVDADAAHGVAVAVERAAEGIALGR